MHHVNDPTRGDDDSGHSESGLVVKTPFTTPKFGERRFFIFGGNMQVVPLNTELRRVVHRLIAIRTAKGLRQHHVSKFLNASNAAVSRIERGFDEDVKLPHLVAYAKATGLHLELSISPDGELELTGSRKNEC